MEAIFIAGGVCDRKILLIFANHEKLKCQTEKTTLLFQEK